MRKSLPLCPCGALPPLLVLCFHALVVGSVNDLRMLGFFLAARKRIPRKLPLASAYIVLVCEMGSGSNALQTRRERVHVSNL